MACIKMCGFNPKCDKRKANKQDSKKQKNVNRCGNSKNVNQVTRVQRQRSKETQSARVTVIIVW